MKRLPVDGQIDGNALREMLIRSIDGSSLTHKDVAKALGVPSPKLSALRNGARPWTLDRVALLPSPIRAAFLRQWMRAEGIPTVASVLRSLADALEP
jgi:hypothetical protein